jgi:ribosomal protein L11 methyltransferase
VTDAWLAVRVSPAGDREAVLGALFALGAQAVEERGDALMTQFPSAVGDEAIRRALSAASSNARVDVEPAPMVDWANRWRDSITAHDLGALTVTPPWLADQFDPARTVVIEPEMAFGTGEHATTQSVVRLLADIIRPGDRVADLGAGSAVLSIAAVKLGAARAAAIEIDPDAIANAEDNVRRNGVEAQVTVIEGNAAMLLPLVAPVRVITANIISSVLVPLLPVMRACLDADGVAILSGMLVTERDEMLAAFAADGWHMEREHTQDVWWTAAIAPR